MRQLRITNKITNRESIALDKYLNDISKIVLLSADEEAELATKVKLGDENALERLATCNLRFVVSVAKQYQNQGLSLGDLINEGNVGLLKAAKRFDETRGFKFISYAVWWIRQSILQAIVEHSRIVRVPLNKVSAYSRVNEAYIGFIQEFEREPGIEELAELLGISEKEVESSLYAARHHFSFDSPINDEEGASTMLDLLQSDKADAPDLKLMDDSLKAEIQNGLSILSPREVDVLSSYYGLNGHKDNTLEEIGELYGLTRERVRQIKDRAIRRLRKSINRNALKSYLG